MLWCCSGRSWRSLDWLAAWMHWDPDHGRSHGANCNPVVGCALMGAPSNAVAALEAPTLRIWCSGMRAPPPLWAWLCKAGARPAQP